MQSNLIRSIAFILFSIILGGISLILWRELALLLMPSLNVYLIPIHGSPIAFGLVSWFLIGGYTTAMMMAWDESESYHRSFKYMIKAWILVPFSVFMIAKTPSLTETIKHIDAKKGLLND